MAEKLLGMNILDRNRLIKIYYDDYYDGGYITYGQNNHHILRSQRRGIQRYPPFVSIDFMCDRLARRVKTRVRLHVLYYFLNYDKIGELSHKCGKSNCVNILHLTIENHETNCNRKLCATNNECQGHDNGDACVLPASSLWYVVCYYFALEKEIARESPRERNKKN